MEALSSSEAFIRALKAPTDPPNASHLPKIELCKAAWETPSLYIPGKAHLIVEWILTRLSKERGETLDTSALLDQRYWALLQALIIPERPAWLTHLTTRIQVIPIFTSFIRCLSNVPLPSFTPIVSSLCQALFPLALPKVTNDTVLDMFFATLHVLSRPNLIKTPFESLEVIATMATNACRDMLTHPSANRKKILSTFLEHHLENWMQSTYNLPTQYTTLHQVILDTGRDIMFIPDTIRPFLRDTDSTELPFKSPIFKSLHSASKGHTSKDPIFALLPPLFNGFITSVRANKATLLGQVAPGKANISAMRVAQTYKVAAINFFAQCCAGPLLFDQSDGLEAKAAKIQTKSALLQLIREHNLYDGSSKTHLSLMQHQVEETLMIIDSGTAGMGVITLTYLGTIMFLDFDLVGNVMHRILPPIFLSPSQAEEASLSLLIPTLTYHSKTRTLRDHIDAVIQCIESGSLLKSNLWYKTYIQVSCGPLFNKKYQEVLTRSLHVYLTPLQAPLVAASFKRSLNRLWERCATQWVIDTDLEMPDPVSPEGALEGAPPGDVLKFSWLARLASSILPSLPLGSLLPLSLHQLRADVHTIRHICLNKSDLRKLVTKILPPKSTRFNSEEPARKGKRTPLIAPIALSDSPSWNNQLLFLSSLRIGYHLQRSAFLWADGDQLDPDDHTVSPSEIHLSQKDLVPLLRDHSMLPELKVEIVKALLYNHLHMPLSFLQPSSVVPRAQSECLDILLDCLERAIAENGSFDNFGWGGHLCFLPTQDISLASALPFAEMVFASWTPVISELASQEQLTRLADILCKLYLTQPPLQHYHVIGSRMVKLHDIAVHALQSSEFWELRPLRGALLVTVDRRLSVISEAMSSLQATASLTSTGTNEAILQDCFSLYHLLLQVPVEYFGKADRGQLIKRSLALDISTRELAKSQLQNTISISRWLTVLRTFIHRVLTESGTFDLIAGSFEFIWNLVSSQPWYDERENPIHAHELNAITLDLIEHGYFAPTRLASKLASSDGVIQRVLQSYISSNPFAHESNGGPQYILRKSLLHLLGTFVKDFRLESVPETIRQSLGTINTQLASEVHRSLILIPTYSAEGDLKAIRQHGREYCQALEAHAVNLMLGKWLGKRKEPSSSFRSESVLPFASGLLAAAAKYEHTTKRAALQFCSALIDVMLEELMEYGLFPCHAELSVPDNIRILKVLALVTLLVKLMLRRQIDPIKSQYPFIDENCTKLGKLFNNLPALYFQTASKMLQNTIEVDKSIEGERHNQALAFLQVSQGLLSQVPEGGHKSAQSLRTACLVRLARQNWLLDWNIRLPTTRTFFELRKILGFIAVQCSANASGLRHIDLNHIWSTIGSVLSPQAQCCLDNAIEFGGLNITTPNLVYSSIANIIISLIRYRRDLVVDFLPHLTHVLILLLMALRRVPKGLVLGKAQRSTLSVEMPWWLRPGDGELGAEAAREFSRVLTSLSLKTIPRGSGGLREKRQFPISNTQEGKANSLATSFSKHAAQILVAYARAIVDNSLMNLQHDTILALTDGIYGLCSIASTGVRVAGGNYGRDWVMEQLGVDGRRIIKALWAEYEKQRYVGGG